MIIICLIVFLAGIVFHTSGLSTKAAEKSVWGYYFPLTVISIIMMTLSLFGAINHIVISHNIHTITNNKVVKVEPGVITCQVGDTYQNITYLNTKITSNSEPYIEITPSTFWDTGKIVLYIPDMVSSDNYTSIRVNIENEN